MSRGNPSISRRLSISVLSLLVFFAILAGTMGVRTIRRELNEAMDNTLAQAALRLLPLAIDDVLARDDPSIQRQLARAASDEGAGTIFQVRDADGRVLIQSHEAPAKPLTGRLVPGFTEDSGHRIYTLSALSGAIFVQVAESLAHRREETMEAATGFILPMIALVPFVALAILIAILKAARPIDSLGAEINKRRDGNLTPLSLDGVPGELTGIAMSVNRLMSRLDSALEAEREFSANAAHELRTPLAGALGQLELISRRDIDPETNARIRQIGVSLSRLGARTEKLLQLARAKFEPAAVSATADLNQVARLTLEDIRRRYPAADIHESIPGGVQKVAFDQDALSIVLRNLLENAVIHGKPDGPLRLHVSADGVLTVTNRSEPMTDDQLESIRLRYQRNDRPATGSGLGLAITSQLARQANALLTLNSFHAEDGHTCFEATLTCAQSK